MKVLNGKKGLIAIALMVAVMLGAYAGQYYIWTANYEIIPLTSFEMISIPSTSGATKGSEVFEEPVITVDGKALKIHFMVESDTLSHLEEDFYELTVLIAVYDEVDGYVAIAELDLVVDGVRNPVVGDNDVFLFEIDYDVLWGGDGIVDELEFGYDVVLPDMLSMTDSFAGDLLDIAYELRGDAADFESIGEFELAEDLRELAEKVDHILEYKVKELFKDLIDIYEETEDMLFFCDDFGFIKASDLEDWAAKLEAMEARILDLAYELDEAAEEFEGVATEFSDATYGGEAEELEGIAGYFRFVAGDCDSLAEELYGEAVDMRDKILDYWRIPQFTPAVLGPDEDYDVRIIIQYWTGAIETATPPEASFIINVYAIEAGV